MVGGGSIGAVRAAELWRFGMMGVEIITQLLHRYNCFLIYSARRFGAGAICFNRCTAQHFGKSLAHLGTVTILYANKKDLLWHPGKDKESRPAGLFLFLAATPIGYATTTTSILDRSCRTGVIEVLSVCVHGFTFMVKKYGTI